MKVILQPKKYLSIAMHKNSYSSVSQVQEQQNLKWGPVVVSTEDYEKSSGIISTAVCYSWFIGLWHHHGFFVLSSGLTWDKNQGKESDNSSWSRESWNKTDGLSVKTSWWVSFQVFKRISNLQAGQPDFEIRAVSPSTLDLDCSKLNHNKDKCNVLSCPWAIGIR